MKHFPGLRKSIGCALLGASLFACADVSPGRPLKTHSAPDATLPTSAQTQAETGAATWEIYQHKQTNPNVRREYMVVARSAQGGIVHTMRLTSLQHLPTIPPASSVNAAVSQLIVDGKGHVLLSTLDSTKVAFHQRLADDVSHAKMEQYGCIGDIFWAIGGLIATLPACALIVPGAVLGPIDGAVVATCVGTVLGGPVAGTVSVIEDCGNGPVEEDFDPTNGGMILVMDEPYTGDWDWSDDGSGDDGGGDDGGGGGGGGDDGWGY